MSSSEEVKGSRMGDVGMRDSASVEMAGDDGVDKMNDQHVGTDELGVGLEACSYPKSITKGKEVDVSCVTGLTTLLHGSVHGAVMEHISTKEVKTCGDGKVDICYADMTGFLKIWLAKLVLKRGNGKSGLGQVGEGSSLASIGRKTHSAHFSLHFEWCWVAPSWYSAESVFTSPLSLSLSLDLVLILLCKACYESNIEALVVYEVRKIMEISKRKFFLRWSMV
ncbi:hypothetical protein LWI29_008511 [Acer saccharum]|uniref:Uncharacterized protein n=1 Tax=Acer saccharum TaxID=4024 RepID=A0AA39T0I7_ACESA|nr:hypothetical protein LWI29_008511 [Acer saccharum]